MKKYTVNGGVIVMTFPKTLYFPIGSKYNKLIDYFVIEGISPDTVTGNIKVTLTNEQRINSFLLDVANLGQPDPENPIQTRVVDFMKEALTDGVTLLTDLDFKRGQNCYFQFNLFVKLTNAQVTDLVTDGIYGCYGSGADGDAAEGELRTWEQYSTFISNGYYFETETEKLIYTPVDKRVSNDQALALLSSTFDVIDYFEAQTFVIDNTFE